jgi:hypothetical protein
MDSLVNLSSSLSLGSSPNLVNSLSRLKLSRLSNLNPINNLTQSRSLNLDKRCNPATNLRSFSKNLHERLVKPLTQAPLLSLNHNHNQ